MLFNDVIFWLFINITSFVVNSFIGVLFDITRTNFGF